MDNRADLGVGSYLYRLSTTLQTEYVSTPFDLNMIIPRGHLFKAVIIMRDIMRGDYARDYARYYARLNLTVTTDVCSIGWLSRAMMCVDKGGVVGQA